MKLKITSFSIALLFFMTSVLALPASPVVRAETLRIGILQSVTHQSLSNIAKGVKKYFRDKDIDAHFMVRVGPDSPDPEKTLTIMMQEITDYDPDLIITLGTQSSQIAAKKHRKAPVVFSAVTDPVGSGLVENLNKPGAMMTGITDMSPVSAQLEMILMVHPDLKSLGIIYSEFEQNAVMIRDHMKKACRDKDIRLIEAPVGRKDSITDSAADIAGRVEALYIPTDNNIVSGLGEIIQLFYQRSIPLYAADPGSVEKGALAALCFDYFSIGLQTGEIGLGILKGKDREVIPVQSPRETNITINVRAAEKLGINLPVDLLLAADKIHDSIPDYTQ
ncbi:MAG: ABC transporter substrate-binding protein [Desulfosalsimonas sp.]